MTTGRCIFQGEFGEILIPDILTFLDMIGKTGVLEVERPDETKHIYWERGEIVFADSTTDGQRIGGFLSRNGWIDPAALAEARQAAKRDDELVKALLRKGALEPTILPRAIKLLVLDIVYSLFEWRTGTFKFVLTKTAHVEKVVLRTSVSNIIMEGTRRLDEWQRIREVFPTDDTRAAHAMTLAEAGVKLAPVEQEVLAQVDGTRTVADIVRLVDHDQFTVLNALLTLSSAGLVRATGSAPRAAGAAPPAPAASAPRPEGVLDLDIGPSDGGGLPDDQRSAAMKTVEAFNNIFAGIHSRIATIKGPPGVEQFASVVHKGSFQKSDVFAGVHFGADGRLPADTILRNLVAVPTDERLPRLKGNLDRLLAQQVLQLDTSYPPDEKKAVSDLIAREKARIAGA